MVKYMSFRAVLYNWSFEEVYYADQNESSEVYLFGRRCGNFDFGFDICRVNGQKNEDSIGKESFLRGCATH